MKAFNDEIRYQIGDDLETVQKGEMSQGAIGNTFKIQKTVYAIRAKDKSGIYRCLFIAEYKGEVLVLHCFKKKTQETSQKGISLAKRRFENYIRFSLSGGQK